MTETQKSNHDQHELGILLTSLRATRIMRHDAAPDDSRHAAEIRPSRPRVGQSKSQQQHRIQKVCENKRKLDFNWINQ